MRNACRLIFLLLFWVYVRSEENDKEDNKLPICATNIVGQTKEMGRGNMHVGVLPSAGNQIKLELAEHEQWPANADFEIYRCALQLEACSSCHIGIAFQPVSAHFSEYQIDKFSRCDELSPILEPCFNMEFVEERADQSGVSASNFLVGREDVYQRKTIWDKPGTDRFNSTGNSLLILLSMRSLSSDSQLFNYLLQNFPMDVHVYSNDVIINGSQFLTPHDQQHSTGYIQSARYPHAYPATIAQNYTIRNTNESGFVRLVFDDFHINYRSLLQVIEDGEIVFDSRITQNRRPKAIQSKSNVLHIHFAANYFTNLVGFKARYEFVSDNTWTERPINCDEFLEGYGGSISLNNQDALVGMHIDCVWLIARFPSFSRMFDHVYLRVLDYQIKGQGLRFEIRKGAYSEGERIFLLFEPQTTNQLARKQPASGFVTTDADGLQCAFYIRLRGYLASTNGLSIVYSQFFRWASSLCPGGEDEFHCANSKCIKRSLYCDGFDHCGDSSDESCHLAGSLFEESDLDISALMALIVGILGLLIIIATIFGILSRFSKHKIAFLRNDNRVLMSFLRHGRSAFATTNVQNTADPSSNAQMASNHSSELAASIHTIGERRFYVLPENQIRVIEAPPAYNDALKHPVSSYTNRGFQSYAETELEMRTSNSLPAPEPTSPKLCYSSTSPARINAIESNDIECEPGPSTIQNEEEEDSTEKRSDKDDETNNEMDDKIETSNESDEPTKLDEPDKSSEPKRREKQACEVKVENLDFESWV